jgi:hypothetical protein
MRTLLVGLVLLLSTPAYAQQQPPVIDFDSVPNPLKLPDNLYFGEVSGIAVNSNGHVFALSRGNTTGPAYAAAAAQLLEFDADGNYLREIGHNLYAWSFAHMVKVDRHDNIWVTDKGSDMVIKFTPAGRVAMVFGRKQEASDEETGPLKHPKPPLPAEPGRFRQVTDVAFDTADNTYISDGYINSRVAKVDKDGNWIKSWANRATKPAIGDIPSEAQVAAGTFAPGSPWSICITPGPNQVLYSADAWPGRIYKLTLGGRVLGVLGESGKQLKQFGWIHEIACPSENLLWVGELLNWRAQKLVLHP